MQDKKRTSGSPIGELDLLRQIRQRSAGRFAGLRVGIGDDCAVLRLREDEEIVVTTDMSLEGRHFRQDWHPAEAVGHRALARGLSDLAAMGARPVAAFLSLGVPPGLTTGRPGGKSWVTRFYDGLLELAGQHKTPLAGGDLAEFPQAVADIVLVGAAPRGRALLRSTTKPGDVIYVSGSLGGSAVGLRALATGQKTTKAQAHLYPQPRLAQGQWLLKRGAATAAMDLSDGLSMDLARLCEASEVRAELEESMLPLAPGASIDDALHGGEDYELLFTAAKETKLPRQIAGVAITPVGRILRRRSGLPQVTLKTAQGAVELKAQGWEHFV